VVKGAGARGGGEEPVLLSVPSRAAGSRLDRFAAAELGVSRSEVQRWIQDGLVTVDGVARQASATLRGGERVALVRARARPTAATPDADVRFGLLHRDDDLVVIDKPAGLVVHPAKGHAGGTLVNGLLALGLFSADMGEPGAAHDRPGIVHRLDKGTTGVMVVARNAAAREGLKVQFQAHTIERAYLAIVVGDAVERTITTLHGRDPRNRMRFTSRVRRGKRAVTHVRVVERFEGAALVECTLETGRTHQIRMHLSEGGTPVLGDPLYGRPPRDALLRDLAQRLGHQALHAAVLGFEHPMTGARLRFTSAPPEDFQSALRALRAGRDNGA
jgi:23S rRNA pseudouridine1911/1915/1917 synthase